MTRWIMYGHTFGLELRMLRACAMNVTMVRIYDLLNEAHSSK